MPLDLIETELLAIDPSDLMHYRRSLTDDGWSIERKYSTATWARLRYIAGVFREEILEFVFLPTSAENVEKLK